jgi:hypothetical protein
MNTRFSPNNQRRAKTTASIFLLGAAVGQFIVGDGIHVVHRIVVVCFLVGLDI